MQYLINEIKTIIESFNSRNRSSGGERIFNPKDKTFEITQSDKERRQSI